MTRPREFLDGSVVLHAGDCRDVLKGIADNSIDSVCCDPPYALVSIGKRFGKEGAAPAKSNGATGVYARASKGFMGVGWDHGAVAFDPELWTEVLRCMKPGAHGLAMGGTRTYHRLVCAIEDAGAEIRDCNIWAYGEGFPKSHNIALDYEKTLCYQFVTDGITKWYYHSDNTPMARSGYRHPKAVEWDGWGTGQKPAVELICMFRKPLSEATVALNVARWGTGAINVAACKIPSGDDLTRECLGLASAENEGWRRPWMETATKQTFGSTNGRWPANLMHDNSPEVLACFPESSFSQSEITSKPGDIYGNGAGLPSHTGTYGCNDSGSAARFFASFPQEDVQRIYYTSKADKEDRLGSKHPTVKPLDLIQYLVRLITPKNGVCLDLFAGTGTTAEACFREGLRCILIEREAEYIADIERRMSLVMEGPVTRANAGMKARNRPRDDGPLFGGSEWQW